MDTLLTPPALNSPEDAARFMDEVLAQAKIYRAKMQVLDVEIAQIVAETEAIKRERERLRTQERQASSDMQTALDTLAAWPGSP